MTRALANPRRATLRTRLKALDRRSLVGVHRLDVQVLADELVVVLGVRDCRLKQLAPVASDRPRRDSEDSSRIDDRLAAKLVTARAAPCGPRIARTWPAPVPPAPAGLGRARPPRRRDRVGVDGAGQPQPRLLVVSSRSRDRPRRRSESLVVLGVVVLGSRLGLLGVVALLFRLGATGSRREWPPAPRPVAGPLQRHRRQATSALPDAASASVAASEDRVGPLLKILVGLFAHRRLPVPACPRYSRVGANSPSLWPTIDSGDEHRHVPAPVMDGDRVPDHLREDRRGPRPGAQHPLLAGGVHRLDAADQPLVQRTAPSCWSDSSLLTPSASAHDVLIGFLALLAGAIARASARPTG